MRTEYIAHLESLLELRAEENSVRADKESSGNVTERVGQTLLNDILLYEYEGIVKKTERELSEVTEYDTASLEKLNEALIVRSKKLEIVWGNVLLLSEFLDSYPFFKGLAEVFAEHKSKLSVAEDIEEINRHDSWVKSILERKGRVEISWMALQAVEELLDGLPLFRGLSQVLSEQKKKLSQAQSIEEINQHIKWIQDALKNRRDVEESWNEVQELQNLLENYSLFQGLAEAFSEQNNKLSQARSIDEINEYSPWTQNILKNQGSIIGSWEILQELEKILNKHQLFKGIVRELTERKKKLAEVTDIRAIEEHHAWLKSLVAKSDKMTSIIKNIRYFKRLSDEKQLGLQQRSVALLAQEAAEVRDASGISLMSRKMNKKRNLIRTILLISEKWQQVADKKYLFEEEFFIREQIEIPILVQESIEAISNTALDQAENNITINNGLADAILNMFNNLINLNEVIDEPNINKLFSYGEDEHQRDLGRIKKHITSLQTSWYSDFSGGINKLARQIHKKYWGIYEMKDKSYPFLYWRDFCCPCVPIPLAINLLSLVFVCPVLVVVRNYRINKMIKKRVFDW
ncbi:MAG: hypothetical protein D3914_06570 [Candidatus Electrothrix sp. LOE2]|nr:hypothetical protein [Candidatus Electrothrix sp. LOE2]